MADDLSVTREGDTLVIRIPVGTAASSLPAACPRRSSFASSPKSAG